MIHPTNQCSILNLCSLWSLRTARRFHEDAVPRFKILKNDVTFEIDTFEVNNVDGFWNYGMVAIVQRYKSDLFIVIESEE